MKRRYLVALLLVPVTRGALFSQPPELSVKLSGYRSLAEAVRRLREKTGWLISVEEPIWPVAAQRSALTTTDPRGNSLQPPAQDIIRVDFPTLRGAAVRPAAVKILLDAYNQQNRGVAVRSMNLADHTVITICTLSPGTGATPEARLILSATAFVEPIERTPTQHVEALARSIGSQQGVQVDVDTAAFGFRFDSAYLGSPDGGQTRWGASGSDARTALVNFLAMSRTSTVWQVDCQVGVTPSPGHCILSLIPLTVEVKDRYGNLTKRTLYGDRGGPKFPPPPPPPPPPPHRP